MSPIRDYLEEQFISGLTDDGFTTAAAREALENEKAWENDGNEQIY